MKNKNVLKQLFIIVAGSVLVILPLKGYTVFSLFKPSKTLVNLYKEYFSCGSFYHHPLTGIVFPAIMLYCGAAILLIGIFYNKIKKYLSNT